jgi:hypothetical protein
LIISFSIDLELYALSRHRCYLLIVLFVFVLDKKVVTAAGSSITALYMATVTVFMSCSLADVITADSGIPFLSVKICLFA